MKKTQMVILAGGSGNRFGSNIPKQYVKIAGKTILEHTIEKIEHSTCIDSMILVVSETYLNYVQELVRKNAFQKVVKIIPGGDTRQASSYAGICACDKDTQNVLFHDAIRPFVSNAILEATVKALERYKAVDVAIPCADTMIQINDQNIITNIPERSLFRRGQTPQGFDLKLIREAYERYLQEDNLVFTDDCGIIKHYQLADIYVIEGEEQNLKITYKEDAYLADKLFQIRSRTLLNKGGQEELEEQLKNKIGIVFGYTSGIGQEIFQMVNQMGGAIYGASRYQTTLDAFKGVDVSKESQVQRFLEEIGNREGKIDYVVNCAGALEIKELEKMTVEAIDALVGVNYLGAVYVTKAAIPFLKETQGSLVLFTSSSYTRGRASYSIYSSTKAAVTNFVQAVAEETYEDKIRINVMNPERTDTPMRRKNFGYEPKETLCPSKKVAEETLRTLMADFTGQIVDVRR